MIRLIRLIKCMSFEIWFILFTINVVYLLALLVPYQQEMKKAVYHCLRASCSLLRLVMGRCCLFKIETMSIFLPRNIDDNDIISLILIAFSALTIHLSVTYRLLPQPFYIPLIPYTYTVYVFNVVNNSVSSIDREFEFYEFFSFLKFNEFYEFFFG